MLDALRRNQYLSTALALYCVGQSTWDNWEEANPDLRYARMRAQAEGEAWVVDQIRKLAEAGDRQSAVAILARGPSKARWSERVESQQASTGEVRVVIERVPPRRIADDSEDGEE